MMIGTPDLLLPHRLPSLPTNAHPNLFFLYTPLCPRRRLCCPCSRGPGPTWDSNAENVRAGRFGFWDEGESRGFGRREKRKWWSDGSAGEFDDGDVLFDDDEPEQPWDKIWIIKVFKSYGYFLPAIIASLLLATGPKAFLMALALPLGQSAFSLAFEKVWGKDNERSRRRYQTNKKPFGRSARDFRMQEEDETMEPEQAKQNYKSWVAADGVNDKGEKRGGRFGGWDELDGRMRYRNAPTGARSSRAAMDAVPQTTSGKRGKLTKRGRNRDVPFFLRLLVAVFPFLGSWTKLL